MLNRIIRTGASLALIAVVAFGAYRLLPRPQAPVQEIALATPSGVTIQGPRYADAKGRTLYVPAADSEAGKQACGADCLKIWPALVAPLSAKSEGQWTVIAGDGGIKQWAYKGKPVHTYSKDAKIGDTLGEAAEGGGWRAVAVKPGDGMALPYGLSVQEIADANGQILVNIQGKTLYAFDGDVRRDAEACGKTADCLRDWLPLRAGEMANAIGDFTIVARADGSDQWAYKGKGLYSFAGDTIAGDVKGTGVDSRWQPAMVVRYFMPPNATIRTIAGVGTVVATTEGLTLYRRDGYRYQTGGHATRDGSRGIPAVGRGIGTKGCDAECLKTWRPFGAPADAQPSGYWDILTRPDGSKQWAYQGYALYSYAGDKKPGDMTGNDIYDMQVNRDPQKVADMSIPISLYWHVAWP